MIHPRVYVADKWTTEPGSGLFLEIESRYEEDPAQFVMLQRDQVRALRDHLTEMLAKLPKEGE